MIRCELLIGWHSALFLCASDGLHDVGSTASDSSGFGREGAITGASTAIRMIVSTTAAKNSVTRSRIRRWPTVAQ